MARGGGGGRPSWAAERVGATRGHDHEASGEVRAAETQGRECAYTRLQVDTTCTTVHDRLIHAPASLHSASVLFSHSCQVAARWRPRGQPRVFAACGSVSEKMARDQVGDRVRRHIARATLHNGRRWTWRRAPLPKSCLSGLLSLPLCAVHIGGAPKRRLDALLMLQRTARKTIPPSLSPALTRGAPGMSHGSAREHGQA